MLVVERHDPAHQVLNRALVLARHLHARLDLLLFDEEYVEPASVAAPGHEQARQRNERSARSAREYLEALRGSIDAPGVEITIDVVGGATLAEAVVHKVLNRCPDLVIRCAHTDGRGEFARGDMRLVQVCPAPVLLTCGRPWHARPHLAAVVDLYDRHSLESTRAVTAMGARLREGCAGELDILYEDPSLTEGEGEGEGAGEGEGGLVAGPRHDELLRRLSELCVQGGVDEEHLHPIAPAATASLARLVESRGFDVLIHAVPDPQPAGAAWSGTTPPNRPLAPLECDLLFVRPGRYQRYDRPVVN